MNKTEAIKRIKAMPGMSARATEAGEIMVWKKADGSASAYLADSPEDAVNTAKIMAQDAMKAANKPRFTVTIAKLSMSPLAHRQLMDGKASADEIHATNYHYTYSAFDADEANAKAVAFHAKKHWAANHPFSITKTVKLPVE